MGSPDCARPHLGVQGPLLSPLLSPAPAASLELSQASGCWASAHYQPVAPCCPAAPIPPESVTATLLEMPLTLGPRRQTCPNPVPDPVLVTQVCPSRRASRSRTCVPNGQQEGLCSYPSCTSLPQTWHLWWKLPSDESGDPVFRPLLCSPASQQGMLTWPPAQGFQYDHRRLVCISPNLPAPQHPEVAPQHPEVAPQHRR